MHKINTIINIRHVQIFIKVKFPKKLGTKAELCLFELLGALEALGELDAAGLLEACGALDATGLFEACEAFEATEVLEAFVQFELFRVELLIELSFEAVGC